MLLRTRLGAALLALAPLLAGCDAVEKGEGPVNALVGQQRQQAFLVGRWSYLLEAMKFEPLLGGTVVADTLAFSYGGKGRWTVVTLDPLDANRRVRAVTDFEWVAEDDGRRVAIIFTCEPRELCDPMPGWYGGISIEGQLEIRSAMPGASDRVRIYGKLED